MTAIYCIEQRGSSNVLRDQITKQIFDLAKKHNFSLQISYIKSKDNPSDRVSRKFTPTSIQAEWTLHEKDFKFIQQFFEFQPEVDLFASHINNKFPQFMSWKLSGYHADTPITIKAEAIHEADSHIH